MPSRSLSNTFDSRDFTRLLMEWYKGNHRKLPWRESTDPYPVWISEVILQQTRVDQGLSYYQAFLSKFPDIASLARASDEEVMKAWQGLGYYSRARNLHEAARQIMERHDGRFPGSYEEIRALRGIGDYTAAAVSSISFSLPYPVIDGNVTRFISRFLGIESPASEPAANRKTRSFLETYIDHDDPGGFNQAVMEFGALVCKPRQPVCSGCLFKHGCQAYQSGRVGQIPLLKKGIRKQHRHFHYMVLVSSEGSKKFTWMKKRLEGDIWKGLYDFPLLEAAKTLESEAILASETYRELAGIHEPVFMQASRVYRHILTHRELYIRFFIFNAPGYYHPLLTRLDLDHPDGVPVPKIIERFLEDLR